MERFKVVERETKTKAYSKEGLFLWESLLPKMAQLAPCLAQFTRNLMRKAAFQPEAFSKQYNFAHSNILLSCVCSICNMQPLKVSTLG